jgi:dTDP-4-dehydrorhamnose 3,5-epimerase
MRFRETPLPGAFLVELELHEDERGFFARTWCREEFEAHGLSTEIAQCSISRNTKRGTLRGMHFQRAPHEETKLVRCVRGTIYDVIVDLRPESPAHTRWFGVELSGRAGNALLIPPGFAHGFQTLEDDTDVLYQISAAYQPGSAAGVAWDDPAFGIEWPHSKGRIMSDRDRAWPPYDGLGSRRNRGA